MHLAPLSTVTSDCLEDLAYSIGTTSRTTSTCNWFLSLLHQEAVLGLRGIHWKPLASNLNFQGGVALLHADYVNYDNLLVYWRWDLALPTWIHELSVHVTDELAKYCVDFNGIDTSFS